MARGRSNQIQGTGTVTIDPAKWWVVALLGLISVVAGVLALAFPDITLLALGLFVGINLVLIGAVWVALGVTEDHSPGGRVLRIVVGILAELSGLVCLVRPGAGVLALLLALAFWFIITGTTDLTRALEEHEHRVIAGILGVVSIAAGIVIVGNPDIGLETLALLAGIAFIVRGTVELMAAFYMRSQAG